MTAESTTILLAVLAATLTTYIALCRWRPFVRCRTCHGQGQTARLARPPSIRNLIAATGLITPRYIQHITSCTRCRGTGYRRRLGRALADTWRRLNRPHEEER